MASELHKLIREKAIVGTVICVDPGERTGWCVIREGRLVTRGTCDARGILPPADACLWEMPRVYADPAKWKGDPQQIVTLAAMGAEYGARYPLSAHVEPRKWRGVIPEKVYLKRLTRSLAPGEIIGASVHARDAQGMALWLLGRLR